MEKRTREILALVLLVVLGLVVVGAMAWYIFVGHNWNQAATHIDDMVGSMDGYTVVVYEGTVKKPKSPANALQRSHDDNSLLSQQKPAALDADVIAEEYCEKGASVLFLPSDALARYEDPAILLRSGKRIGVLSFDGKYRYNFGKLRNGIRYLKRHSVDFIVAVGKDKRLLKGRLDGIDLLVLKRDADLPEGGECRGSAFCVDSPYRGEVQVVIASPSGVMTSRSVHER